MIILSEKESVLKRYNELKSIVVERGEQFANLIAFLENETEWLRAPASTRFHLCEEMGLLLHSVNVADTLLRLKSVLAPSIPDETCIIIALIHDIGKVGMPGRPQYLVNLPTERQMKYGYKPDAPYRFNTDLIYMSVPVRSLYLALKFIDLSEDEVQAIMYHDGQYVDDNKSCANKEVPLTLLLQFADLWSCSVVEKHRDIMNGGPA